jgi:hypothetical protein
MALSAASGGGAVACMSAGGCSAGGCVAGGC